VITGRRNTTVRIIWTIIGGVVGLVLSDSAFAIAAYLAVRVRSSSDAESTAALFGIFGLGPLVGLLGCGLGVWLALRFTHRAP